MNALDTSIVHSVGVTLANCRKKAGLRQTDVAAKLKLSRSVISRIERGKRDSGVDELFNFAKACGARLIFSFAVMTPQEELVSWLQTLNLDQAFLCTLAIWARSIKDEKAKELLSEFRHLTVAPPGLLARLMSARE